MFRTALLCLILGILTASCSSTPADNSPSSAANTSKQNAGDSDMPVPPSDAQFTIRCQAYNGPTHAEVSRMVAKQLRSATKMKDWYVVHGNDSSTLFYGFYRTINPRDLKDGREGRRAIDDLNQIRSMADSQGYRPFSASLLLPLDAPDPAADPKWDLARSGGYYSLEIAVFQGNALRKEAAVQAVKEFRAKGVEAYYYHGPNVSSVCIGAWPQSSAQEVDIASQNTDPTVPIVVTSSPLGEDAARQFAQNGYKSIAPRIDPVDPAMIAVMRQFPNHYVNYELLGRKVQDPATGQQKVVPSPSFLVKIPQAQDQSNTPMVDTGPPTDTTHIPIPNQPGVGQLKSLGD